MSVFLPIVYASAFLLFLGAARFGRNLEGLRFESPPPVEDKRGRVGFYSGTGVFVVLLMYGIFSDVNYTIQEYANLQEIGVGADEIAKFLFSGNLFGHQHLYHLLLAIIVRIFGLERPENALIAGRLVSALFGIGTLLLFKQLLLSVPRAISRTATRLVFAMMPLNFFYFMQAEPYSMLLFMCALNARLFLLLGNESIKVTIAFIIVTILGYFTHYFFLVLPAAEALFVIYLWVFKKKKYRRFEVSLLFVLPVLLLTYRSILVMLTSPFIEYQQGYFGVDARFFLTQLYAFWGLTRAVYGSNVGATAVIYAALVVLLIDAITRNRRNELTVFLAIILLSEMGLFILFTFITARRGYMTVTLRHYIPITIPVALLYFTGSGESQGKARKYLLNALWVAALAAYLASDVSFLIKRYRTDGRNAGKYLVHMREEKKATHISMASWLENCTMNPWLNEAGMGRLKGDYYLTDIVDNINNDSWPTRYKEGDPWDEIRMRTLLIRIKHGRYGFAFDKSRSAAENLNAFIASSGVTDAILKRIMNERIRIPAEVARIAKTRRASTKEQKEIDALVARLYLELLYPEGRTRESVIDIFVQENRVKKIVADKHGGEMFLFMVIKEQIVGMEYVDLREQYEALETVRKMRGVKELFRKDFNNVEIYGFMKR